MSLSIIRPKNFNLCQLAGANRILGVDLTEYCVRVVEIEERILPIQKSKSRFIVRNHFTLEFDPKEEWLNKADLLKQKLIELGIRTHYAATSIRSIGIKVVETIIPSSVHAVDEWITENQEKLLRIPISTGSIVHSAEMLERTDSGNRVEITFVKKEEIERWQSFIQTTGLELITLGAGIRDASNVMMLEKDFGVRQEKFLFASDNSVNVTEFIQGRRSHSYQAATAIRHMQPEESSVFVSGEEAVKANPYNAKLILPFGLSPEYCLAVGFALKALDPDLSPINFLPAEETNRIEVNLYKTLFQRAVLFSGIVLITFLLIPFSLGIYFDWRSNKLDEQLLANGSSYTELKLLETQTHDLEKQLNEAGTSNRSSHTAKLLHNIASVSPEGLWLYKLKLDTEKKGASKLSLFGYTLSSEKVTDYLKNLNALGYEAYLVRSGNPQQNETLIPLRKDAVSFEIGTQVKN